MKLAAAYGAAVYLARRNAVVSLLTHIDQRIVLAAWAILLSPSPSLSLS